MTEEADPIEASRMSLAEHLDELRTRVMRSVIAIAIAFALAWGFHRTLAAWWTRRSSVRSQPAGWARPVLATPYGWPGKHDSRWRWAQH